MGSNEEIVMDFQERFLTLPEI